MADDGAVAKAKVAVFPLGGDAVAELRERAGFALRVKLDRGGIYEPIDGPAMNDLAATSAKPIDFESSLASVEELAASTDAEILIWGDVQASAEGPKLRLRVFDQRQFDPLPHAFERVIASPTDLRFVIESVLETLESVSTFEHPNESAVQRDAAAEALWAKNPNLVANGSFDQAGEWDAIYMAEKYPVPLGDQMPEQDKVAIYRQPGGENVLAMNLSRRAAENNGLACLSAAIAIEPNTRYRLSFKYRSDGPRLHVFVKGYTTGKNIKGEPTDREVYRRQVPPSGETDGQWVTIVDELNPQNPAYPVEKIRVDLFAYLKPGVVMFDDVVLKAVGEPTRKAKDDALKKH